MIIIKNEQIDKLLKIEKVLKISKEIIKQSKDNNEIMNLLKALNLINKYKFDLPHSFNERKFQYKLQQKQVNIGQNHVSNCIDNKKFNYKIINEYPNIECCFSFVFNQDSTRLFIGQQSDINVFEFKNGKIKKQLKKLKQHKHYIYCLVYMNKSNLLISGSYDQSIVIWNLDQNGSWKLQKVLQGHQDWIRCLIKNKDEDLLISGSDDNSIKLWRKTNTNWNCQQNYLNRIYSYQFKLSQSQSKLISCGWYSNQILVMQQKLDQQWFISQTIIANANGQHLLFISDNRFAYQGQQDYLQIYLYDQIKQQYIEDKQINVQQYDECMYVFPCKYIEQKNIFIIKNSRWLNCFRIDKQQNYILQQSIYYSRNFFFGNISKNGQYIITQQEKSDQIEIRELQYLE